MARHIKAEAKTSNGHLTVHSQDSDALILPVAQMQALQEFRPDIIDVIVEETRIEANHRRAEESKVNTYIFIERMGAQVAAVTLAVLGICGGIYAALNGQPWIGGLIVTATIGTLAVGFIQHQRPKPK